MYYFLIDRHDTLMNAQANHLCASWKAVGQNKQYLSLADRDEPILALVRFTGHGQMDAFTALPGVTFLGDPLEADEMQDEHMGKLQRFHPFRKQLPLAVPPQAQVWMDTSNGNSPLSRKPHVRQLMTTHVGKMFPALRFRLFG
jgi:hypothetical protein